MSARGTCQAGLAAASRSASTRLHTRTVPVAASSPAWSIQTREPLACSSACVPPPPPGWISGVLALLPLSRTVGQGCSLLRRSLSVGQSFGPVDQLNAVHDSFIMLGRCSRSTSNLAHDAEVCLRESMWASKSESAEWFTSTRTPPPSRSVLVLSALGLAHVSLHGLAERSRTLQIMTLRFRSSSAGRSAHDPGPWCA